MCVVLGCRASKATADGPDCPNSAISKPTSLCAAFSFSYNFIRLQQYKLFQRV